MESEVILYDNLDVAADGSEGEPIFVDGDGDWMVMPPFDYWVSLGCPKRVKVVLVGIGGDDG